MATEIIGKCFICKKEITRHDISHTEEGNETPIARFWKGWPGDGVLCVEHPGVEAEYQKALEEADGKLR